MKVGIHAIFLFVLFIFCCRVEIVWEETSGFHLLGPRETRKVFIQSHVVFVGNIAYIWSRRKVSRQRYFRERDEIEPRGVTWHDDVPVPLA